MILVILGVFVIIFAIGIIINTHTYGNDLGEIMAGIGGFVGGLALVAAIILAVSVSFSGTVDEKINMYEEQNAKIESQIEAAVEKYMTHESETFSSLSPESAITLVALYPELKSDTLISSQIDIYLKNNAKIVELQEMKINAGVARWWLYFGK